MASRTCMALALTMAAAGAFGGILPTASLVKASFKSGNLTLDFRASSVLQTSPLEGVALRGCEGRCRRAGFSVMKKTGKVQKK